MSSFDGSLRVSDVMEMGVSSCPYHQQQQDEGDEEEQLPEGHNDDHNNAAVVVATPLPPIPPSAPNFHNHPNAHHHSAQNPGGCYFLNDPGDNDNDIWEEEEDVVGQGNKPSTSNGSSSMFAKASLNESIDRIQWAEAEERIQEEEEGDLSSNAGSDNVLVDIPENNRIGIRKKRAETMHSTSSHSRTGSATAAAAAARRPANYKDYLRAQRAVKWNGSSRELKVAPSSANQHPAAAEEGVAIGSMKVPDGRGNLQRRRSSTLLQEFNLQVDIDSDDDDDRHDDNADNDKQNHEESEVLLSDVNVEIDNSDEEYDEFDIEKQIRTTMNVPLQEQQQIPSQPNNNVSASAASAATPPSGGGANNRRQSFAETKRMLKSMRALAPKMKESGDISAVDSMVYELEKRMKKLDVDGHFKTKENLRAPWYSVPIQRQRWNDQQTLPDSNYGSLFFDLFFIGAVYNIQEMLLTITAEDWLRSILYFIGIFGPIFVTWETDVYYHSRYCVVDYAHRLFDVIRFVFVTTSVLFIQPMQELKNPQTSIASFALCTSILGESILHLLLNIEVYYKAEGDKTAIKNHTERKIKGQLLPTSITYFVAAFIAGLFYFVPNLIPESHSDQVLWSITDLPLSITAVGYSLNSVFTWTRKIRSTSGSKIDIRKTFVPNNIDYVISRYNDWFLLLLGEVVMAMVEITDSERNYLVASMGALTTIIIHTLKFESEPGQAHGHALWRNISNATCFSVLTQILSVGLILFGVSYKILLTDGQLGLTGTLCNVFLCSSLAWVLISLELLVVTHKGINKTYERLFRRRKNDEEGGTSVYWSLVFITLFKISLLVYLVTIPVWTSNTDVAVVNGVVVVIFVALTRIVGWAFVHREEEIRNFVTSTTRKIASKAVSIVDPRSSSMHRGADASSIGKWSTQSDVTPPSRRNVVTSLRTSTRVPLKSPSTNTRKSLFGSRRSDQDENSSVSSNPSLTLPRKQAQIYDEMFDAVVLIDLKGLIITANQTALDVFRYKAKTDLVGRNVSMLVGVKDAQYHDAYLEAFNRKTKQQTQIGKQRVLKAKRSDGTEFPCIIGIKRTNHGKHLVGYIRDMTDIGGFGESRKSVDSSLGDDDFDDGLEDSDDSQTFAVANEGALHKKYKKHLARVLDDKSFDCIVVADLYGVIMGVNKTLVKEFRFRSKEELIGENLSILMCPDLIPPDVHDGYLTMYREKYEQGGHVSRILGNQRQLSAQRRDGSIFKCIIGVHDIDGVDLLVGYIRNVESIK